MLKLALQLASLWKGTLAGCRQLLTLPMGDASSLDQVTAQFECGMLRLALQLASLWKGALAWCRQLLTLPMRSIQLLDPIIRIFIYATHLHKLIPYWPRPSRLNGQTKRVGSQTRGAVYFIGSLTPIVQASISIHLTSSQFPPRPLFGQFLFNLMSLHLDRLGPKFSTLYGPSLFLSLTLCLYFALLAAL